ncbi:MAG: NADH-quinone oxidoreductase subunit H [Candidatus Scalindua rubra]|uniref:Membrane-bound [NiFe]-hydrogenase-3, subunit D n=1 Tax=Candidatus Scalindua brodae TaxID=237368 RepID=A0A0B0ER15_9BACT|nr:MAG: membrane-bound [NiFe]-hydrogenase-3, subunit D [Candidatus Scalindua brodae]MBZ0107837.1 NADH-quinone oxidoreductase subunit H [Candidatus Scalindua rubra]TWU29198.1 Formate hydrogenlyase subunit 4 [Candidatus Brocadiaceae bacterium S225]
MENMQFIIIVIFSPLIQGIIKKLKANFQGRVGSSIFQPYYDLMRLFKKEMVVSHVTSWIFRVAPYIVFVSTIMAAIMVPVITTKSTYSITGDIIVLIYIFAMGKFFMALAALDSGTAFGGEGSSREMMVSILVEPMIMLCIFTTAIAAGSTNLAVIAEQHNTILTPSHMLAFFAFMIAIVADTGRIPVDNPDTHLELTMIHEGMLLEYSGRYLALMEWAHYMKQMLLFTIVVDMFFPLGIAYDGGMPEIAVAFGSYFLKILFLAGIMSVVESTRAKLRFFELPSLLGGSFALAVLSLLTLIMIGR